MTADGADGGLGLACAFASSVTWAVGSATYSRLALSATPFAVSFSRALVALPLFAVTAVATSGWAAYSVFGWERVGWLTLSMVGSYGLGDACFLLSTRALGVPGALAIASAYPAWTAVWGMAVEGHALGWTRAAGLVLALGGVIAVILGTPAQGAGAGAAPTLAAGGAATRTPEGPEGSRFKRPSRAVGVALAVATSMFWALNSLAVSKGGMDANPAAVNSIRMAMALVVCAALGLLAARDRPLLLARPVFRRALPVIGLEAFCGSLMFTYAMSRAPLVVATTLSSLAPVISVPVAWAMGIERVSFARTAGVLAVVAGVVLLVAA